MFEDVPAISLRSVQRLAQHELLTEADLQDEGGLPF